MAEKLIPKYYGQYLIKFNRPIGRVYYPDGTVTENVFYVEIGRNNDGTIKYAYPIVKPKNQSSLREINDGNNE